MNSAVDRLHLWMSERGEGSWQQFRSGVVQFCATESADEGRFPMHQLLKFNLQRLAHVEFGANLNGPEWKVVPPALAALKLGDSVRAFLCGARSWRINEAIDGLTRAGIATALVEPGCPSIVALSTATYGALQEIAARNSLHLQEEAPRTLLAAVSAIDSPGRLIRDELPIGERWSVFQFDPYQSIWQATERREAERQSYALLRFSDKYSSSHFLVRRGEVFRTTPQVGKFLVLRRRSIHVLQYDHTSERLYMPPACRPPLLIERALVLCSGRMPRVAEHAGRSSIVYEDVPEDVARTSAALLRQELR